MLGLESRDGEKENMTLYICNEVRAELHVISLLSVTVVCL